MENQKILEMTVTGLAGVSTTHIGPLEPNKYISPDDRLQELIGTNIGDMISSKARVLHRIRKDNSYINQQKEILSEMLDDDNITPTTLFNTDFGKSGFVKDGASDSRGYLIDHNTMVKDPIDEIRDSESVSKNTEFSYFEKLAKEVQVDPNTKKLSNQSVDKIFLLTKELSDGNAFK